MSNEARQRVLLGVLLLVLAGVAAWRFGLIDTRGGVFARGRQVDYREALRTEVVDLDTDLLARPSTAFSPGRNPWDFERTPTPAAPVVDVAPPRAVAPEPVHLTEISTEPAKPRPPDVDFKYLGRFGPKGRPIAVLVDSDGATTYNALVGDVVKQMFRVEAIGLESVQIGYVGFPDEPPARLAVSGAG